LKGNDLQLKRPVSSSVDRRKTLQEALSTGEEGEEYLEKDLPEEQIREVPLALPVLNTRKRGIARDESRVRRGEKCAIIFKVLETIREVYGRGGRGKGDICVCREGKGS